jgi:hypothetical protein
LQFLSGLIDAVSIVAVNHEDDTLGILEVMSPQGSDFVLSTHIPDRELNVLVFYGLDIEANGRNCGDDFTKPANVSDLPQIIYVKPYFNLYRMVVFPAASRPTMRIRISFFPKNRSNNFEIVIPMVVNRAERGFGRSNLHTNKSVNNALRQVFLNSEIDDGACVDRV